MNKPTRYEYAAFIDGKVVKVFGFTVRKGRNAMFKLLADNIVSLRELSTQRDQMADCKWRADLERFVWADLAFGCTGATEFQRENEAK